MTENAALSLARQGPAPNQARLTIVAVHGRGAAAANILPIATILGLNDVAYVAPNAPGGTWYPYSFLSALTQNEPQLTASLGVLDAVVGVLHAEGVTDDRIGFLGFSQGACLALEFVARRGRRHAAVIAFSGGLIGPPGTPRDYCAVLDGMPVFLGCSDVDPHIPLARVHESADVFRRLGADVTERIYPGMGHLVSDDELDVARTLLGP
jgi:predicted esterase